MKLLHVVGARPNFMKLAPVYRAISSVGCIQQVIVHTGQHYDFNMSGIFFQQFGLHAPDVNLQVGSGTHAGQTAEIMIRLEELLSSVRPDLVLVYGDVNSTMAAALVCSKIGVRLGHVEAGLRSFDRSMPEEVNRLITDQLADFLFTPSVDADENLTKEGIPKSRIELVGNVMIDTLIQMLPESDRHVPDDLPDRFVLVTLHRPSNVDDPIWLDSMLNALSAVSSRTTVLFPAHPRTAERIKRNSELGPFVRIMDPQPYLTFLAMQKRADAVITDSGGIQEETTYLGVPCLTVRENTERPVTTTLGTNLLVGRDPERITHELERVLAGKDKKGGIPPFWDGHAAERIAKFVARTCA